MVDGPAARGGFVCRGGGGLQAAELDAGEFLPERGGRPRPGEAGLQGRLDGGFVAGAAQGGGELEPAERAGREAARHLAEQLDHARAVAGIAVERGQPQQRALGIGTALQEILDQAQSLGGLALEDEHGRHAQGEAFVAGIQFRGLPVGVVGRGVIVGQFVVDAEGIEGVGLRRPFPVGRQKGGRRNDPSVQQGRRGGQRAATGRDAEEDEAER